MTDEPDTPGSLVAAGGWCAPSTTMYGLTSMETLDGMLSLPDFRILRPGTPEYDAHQAKMRAEAEAEMSLQRLVHRLIRNVTREQDEALGRVYAAALTHDLDVLLEGPPYGHTMWRWNQHAAPPYRFIGLALVERSTETWRRLQGDHPIIIRETASGPYDEDWDD